MCSYFTDGESALCNQPINHEDVDYKITKILLEIDNITGEVNDNVREELSFNLEAKGEECDESGVYILYTEGDRKCEIGCDSEYLGYLCRYMSYSELVKFSKAVNKVIEMMGDNRKEK